MSASATSDPIRGPEPSYEKFARAWSAMSVSLPANDGAKEATWNAIAAGDVKLFAANGAALLVRIHDGAPSQSRYAFVMTATGTSEAMNALMDDVAEWALANGCAALSMYVPPEEAGVFDGFEPTAVTLMRGLVR